MHQMTAANKDYPAKLHLHQALPTQLLFWPDGGFPGLSLPYMHALGIFSALAKPCA